MPSIFSLDKLGPLPDPFDRERYFDGPKEKTFELFTAYQMRAYAAAEVAKERERWEASLNAARGALADIATSDDMTLALARRKAQRVYSETEVWSQDD